VIIEAVSRDQAPAGFQRIAERMLRGRCFRSGVNHLGGDRRILRPRWNETPSDQRQFSGGLLRILADDGDRLGWGYVEARSPVRFVGTAIEIFLDKLLPPRQPVTPAHNDEIIADCNGAVMWRGGRDVCLHHGQTSAISLTDCPALRYSTSGICYKANDHPQS
jgi:hypothetical protein